MIYKVSALDDSEIVLNETDPVKSIVQGLRILLSTRQQSVPLYRSFGLPQQWLDKPANVAETILVQEVATGIREVFPKMEIIKVMVEYDEDAPGRLIPVVEVKIDEKS